MGVTEHKRKRACGQGGTMLYLSCKISAYWCGERRREYNSPRDGRAATTAPPPRIGRDAALAAEPRRPRRRPTSAALPPRVGRPATARPLRRPASAGLVTRICMGPGRR